LSKLREKGLEAKPADDVVVLKELFPEGSSGVPAELAADLSEREVLEADVLRSRVADPSLAPQLLLDELR